MLNIFEKIEKREYDTLTRNDLQFLEKYLEPFITNCEIELFTKIFEVIEDKKTIKILSNENFSLLVSSHLDSESKLQKFKALAKILEGYDERNKTNHYINNVLFNKDGFIFYKINSFDKEFIEIVLNKLNANHENETKKSSLNRFYTSTEFSKTILNVENSHFWLNKIIDASEKGIIKVDEAKSIINNNLNSIIFNQIKSEKINEFKNTKDLILEYDKQHNTELFKNSTKSLIINIQNSYKNSHFSISPDAFKEIFKIAKETTSIKKFLNEITSSVDNKNTFAYKFIAKCRNIEEVEYFFKFLIEFDNKNNSKFFESIITTPIKESPFENPILALLLRPQVENLENVLSIIHDYDNEHKTKLLDYVVQKIRYPSNLDGYEKKTSHLLSLFSNFDEINNTKITQEFLSQNGFMVLNSIKAFYKNDEYRYKDFFLKAIKYLDEKTKQKYIDDFLDEGEKFELFPKKYKKSELKLTHGQISEFYTGWQRWEKFGLNCPDNELTDYSPYGFKPKLYDELLPIMNASKPYETDDFSPEVAAYKLAVLFPNKNEVDKYLRTYASRQQTVSGNIFHDATLFDIPEKGEWDITFWRLQVSKDIKCTKYIGQAAQLKKFIEKNDLLKPKNYEEIKLLSSQFLYRRAAENPNFAIIAKSYNLSEDRFEAALDLSINVGKTSNKLPDVFIDGSEIGHHNFYFAKLESSDPVGLILGDITNCCQSIGKEGSSYAKDGYTQETCGFYVWKKKTDGQITSEDKIVAQSYAWIGKDIHSTKLATILDSYEGLGDSYDRLAQPFLEHFAYILSKNKEIKIKDIRLGTSGSTPNLNLNKEYFKPTEKVSYESNKHYIIKPVNHYLNGIEKSTTTQNLG
jgi:hypothetical protein